MLHRITQDKVTGGLLAPKDPAKDQGSLRVAHGDDGALGSLNHDFVFYDL